MTNDHRGECRSYSPLSPLPLFFVAFCRFLLTNVAICRLQSIAHYTLHSAKRVRGDSPRPLSRSAHLYTNAVAMCVLRSFPPLAFATAPKGGSNPLEQWPSVLISYHAKASSQWWLRHCFASKKASH